MGNSNRRNREDPWSPPTPAANDENLTPLTKLKNKLKIHDNKPGTRFAVLVATGSYCPIHKMHVEVFEVAKKVLEERHNYKVVGGFLSPSHHVHVHAKVGDFAIPSEDRVKMSQIALKESDWVEVSSWEAAQPYFVDLGAVTRQITEFISYNVEPQYSSNITVFYLCGADLAVRCGFHNRNGNRPMRFVGVCRPGFGEQLRREWKEYVEKNPLQAKQEERLMRDFDDITDEPADNNNNVNNNNGERHFILVETETEDFSSTAVRECIVNENFDEMEKMLHPGVAEYIRAKNYFNYAEIAKGVYSPPQH